MSSQEAPKLSRSERTKAAILAAARQRFAADGYGGATIRAIAADADIDPALVIRYFGSKESLFAAAAEFNLRLPDISGMSPRDVARTLVGHFLKRWEEDDSLMALVRAAATNEAAAVQIQNIFGKQILPVVAKLRNATPRAVATRAGLVASQMLGVALTRYILRLPPMVTMDRHAIVEWVSPTLERYIFGEN
ncbi:MAG TPA: TetR family transcriptional regulator [Noviherbaspirillum sp.]|nr:TetR family transcriptional regulator [Noviherbaspirillum sp.]